MEAQVERNTYTLNQARPRHPKSGILTIKYPVGPNGLITNFDDYEKVLHTAFYNTLRVAPEEQLVCMPQHPTVFEARAVLEKVTQIAFESFNAPALSAPSNDVMAVFAQQDGALLRGRSVVLHSGFDSTIVSHVVGGQSVPGSIVTGDIGGAHVSVKLMEHFNVMPPPRALVEEIKKKMCFVMPDDTFRSMYLKQPPAPRAVQDLGGEELQPVGSVVFEAPEVLFSSNPATNLADLVVASIARTGESPSKLVLAGGNCNFPGLAQRVVGELRKRGVLMEVVNPTGDRARLAYYGASMLVDRPAPLASFWMTKEAYDETGPTLAHTVFRAPVLI